MPKKDKKEKENVTEEVIEETAEVQEEISAEEVRAVAKHFNAAVYRLHRLIGNIRFLVEHARYRSNRNISRLSNIFNCDIQNAHLVVLLYVYIIHQK